MYKPTDGTICRVGVAEALVDEEVLTTTLLLELGDKVEVEKLELVPLVDEMDDVEGFTEEVELESVDDFDELTNVELEATVVEDFEELTEVVDTTVELDTLDDVDDDRTMLLLEALVESKYNSRRFPAPQYS